MDKDSGGFMVPKGLGYRAGSHQKYREKDLVMGAHTKYVLRV